MTNDYPTDPGLDLTPGDLAALRRRYSAQDVLVLFQALSLPVCDDSSAIAQVVERERRQREQDSLSADPAQRQDAAIWLNAARLLNDQPSRRELLVLVQEEVNRMLGFRLERYGQAGKPYTPDLRADLKAAAARGFALNDTLAERFMRAFEHGCELRFGVRVPLTLRGFNAREIAAETFEATLTTLLPLVPPTDTPTQADAPAPQHTAPIPAVRPKQPVTRVSAPIPTPQRRTLGPVLRPAEAQTRLVITQAESSGEQSAEWLLTQDTLSIGRMPDSDICLKEDGRVSRRHAVIHRAPTAFILTDLNSANGTFLNGALLTEPAVLHSGDLIRVGHTELTFIMEPLINHANE